jgi:hypothetical protein
MNKETNNFVNYEVRISRVWILNKVLTRVRRITFYALLLLYRYEKQSAKMRTN